MEQEGAAGKTTRIVLATHGFFSEGIKSSLEMIAGGMGNVECVCSYVDPATDYRELFSKLVSEHDYAKQTLVVMTDLMGGSVNNEFMMLRARYPFILVTGLNLALLIEVALHAGPLDEKEVARMARESRSLVCLCGDGELKCGKETDF